MRQSPGRLFRKNKKSKLRGRWKAAAEAAHGTSKVLIALIAVLSGLITNCDRIFKVFVDEDDERLRTAIHAKASEIESESDRLDGIAEAMIKVARTTMDWGNGMTVASRAELGLRVLNLLEATYNTYIPAERRKVLAQGRRDLEKAQEAAAKNPDREFWARLGFRAKFNRQYADIVNEELAARSILDDARAAAKAARDYTDGRIEYDEFTRASDKAIESLRGRVAVDSNPPELYRLVSRDLTSKVLDLHNHRSRGSWLRMIGL